MVVNTKLPRQQLLAGVVMRCCSATMHDPQGATVAALAVPESWGLPAEMTLKQVCHDRFLLAWGHLMAPRDVVAYRGTIRWWVEITGDPPLSRINGAMLGSYLVGLTLGKFPRPLVVKHCRRIRKLLDYASSEASFGGRARP